ncbi:MAG: N-acyl homoserine lactonase family protein [Phenylobacterium sp.]|uniref:N-acyl homoserine lactonase family protein n=1 Tax=Phenylobacterium sp. TaxID=1871053 RepID=UPI00391BDC4B
MTAVFQPPRGLVGVRAARALLAVAFACILGAAWPVRAAEPSDLALWRLDCGRLEIGDLDDYSDAFLYAGRKAVFTDSCYLIRNGGRYLLWDTGLSRDLVGRPASDGGDRLFLDRSIRDQLAVIGVRPEQITFVGISHHHFDHTGQAADFPGATLLIDRRDWEVIGVRPDLSARFGPWLGGGAKVEPLAYDHDVFGDGSVVMLRTPGHTPGHRSLLVRLPRTGPVLLSGDVVHFDENLRREGVPGFNTSRAESLASIARLKAIAASLGAKIIIPHEPTDVADLPAFPQAAN